MILKEKLIPLLFIMLVLCEASHAHCGDSGNKLFDQTLELISSGESGADYPSATDELIAKNTFELVYGRNTLSVEQKLDLVYVVSREGHAGRIYSGLTRGLLILGDERVCSSENRLFLFPSLFEYHCTFGTLRKFVIQFPNEFHLDSLDPAQNAMNKSLYEKLSVLKESDNSDDEIVGRTRGAFELDRYTSSRGFLSKYPCLKRH